MRRWTRGQHGLGRALDQRPAWAKNCRERHWSPEHQQEGGLAYANAGSITAVHNFWRWTYATLEEQCQHPAQSLEMRQTGPRDKWNLESRQPDIEILPHFSQRMMMYLVGFRGLSTAPQCDTHGLTSLPRRKTHDLTFIEDPSHLPHLAHILCCTTTCLPAHLPHTCACLPTLHPVRPSISPHVGLVLLRCLSPSLVQTVMLGQIKMMHP